MHLFLVVNGLFGTTDNMRCTAESIEASMKSRGDPYMVHVCTSVQKFSTFDGIELSGLRLFNELLDILAVHSQIDKISLVGYSMGGLYTRYLAGLLLDHGILEKLKPMNFLTIATPHLGTTMWKPGLSVQFWNMLGYTLLGPSGVDLMTRGPNGILDKMSDPNSVFYKALQRFDNLLLVCNAIGDRSVNFWTSYMTTKHPFPSRDRMFYKHTMYKLGSDTHGPFLVDMQVPILNLPRPQRKEKKETSLQLNLVYLLLPFFSAFMLSVSFIKWGYVWALKRVYRFQCNKKAKTLSSKTIHTSGVIDERNTVHDSEQNGISLNQKIHTAVEEGPVNVTGSISDNQSIDDNSPLPVLNNSSKLIDECRNTIHMNQAILDRMSYMNTLPWKKYVAYLHHYRTHAFIVDRLHQGDSEATELLRYISSQLVV